MDTDSLAQKGQKYDKNPDYGWRIWLNWRTCTWLKYYANFDPDFFQHLLHLQNMTQFTSSTNTMYDKKLVVYFQHLQHFNQHTLSD